MRRDEVRSAFIEILRSSDKDIDERLITESTSLITDLGISSTKMVDIVLETEIKFGIEIDSESMEQFFTVGSAVELIQAKSKLKQ